MFRVNAAQGLVTQRIRGGDRGAVHVQGRGLCRLQSRNFCDFFFSPNGDLKSALFVDKEPTITVWGGASLVAQMVKNPPAMQETRGQSLGWEDPLEKGMATIPVFLPGEFHGQRSLVGYSPQGCKESDTTKRLTLTHSLTHITLLRLCDL